MVTAGQLVEQAGKQFAAQGHARRKAQGGTAFRESKAEQERVGMATLGAGADVACTGEESAQGASKQYPGWSLEVAIVARTAGGVIAARVASEQEAADDSVERTSVEQRTRAGGKGEREEQFNGMGRN